MSPHKDPEARRKYQRERMRRIRAKQKPKTDPPVPALVKTASAPLKVREKSQTEKEGGTPAWVIVLIILGIIAVASWFLLQIQRYYLGW